MNKLLYGWMICALCLAGCAAPGGAAQNTPEAGQPTPDDSHGVTPIPPQGQIGVLDPPELALEVVAWGAPTDGQMELPAQVALFTGGSGPSAPLGVGGELPPGWVDGLPAEVRAAIASVPPGQGEWLILLYGGSAPSPCFWVALHSARVEGRSLRLDWSVQPPPPDTGCADVIAYPYLLLRLKEADQFADQVVPGP